MFTKGKGIHLHGQSLDKDQSCAYHRVHYTVNGFPFLNIGPRIIFSLGIGERC